MATPTSVAEALGRSSKLTPSQILKTYQHTNPTNPDVAWYESGRDPIMYAESQSVRAAKSRATI